MVKREDLESETLAVAEKIAKQPMMGLKLAKMAVNQSLDAQGMWNAVQSAFGLHHLGHANFRLLRTTAEAPKEQPTTKIRREARADKPKAGADQTKVGADQTKVGADKP